MPTLITGPLDTLPVAPDPATDTPTSFSTKAAAMVLAIKTMVPQLITIISEMNVVTTEVNANTVTASAAATSASSNTALAAGYAGATVWVSGTTYAIGNNRYSPANGRVYRRLTAGAGTTDPSADFTNWAIVGLNAPAQLITAPAQTALAGSCYALTNSTTQGAATNAFLYSEQIDNAVWVKVNITVSGGAINAIMGPNGEVTADKLVEGTAAAAYHSLQQGTTGLLSGTAYTVSVYLKSAGRTTVILGFDNTGCFSSGYQYGKFRLATGVASTHIGTAAVSMDHVGNGWYRCTVTATTNAAGNVSVGFQLMDAVESPQYTGDGVSGVYFWGFQLETGSTATSYIPTTSAQVSRASGVVAPQRVVLPASPQADAWVRTVIANGIDTNLIDPNGQTIEDTAGPMTLDKSSGSVELQFINSSWRLV